jgi:undecaprenyl-diphosphatase
MVPARIEHPARAIVQNRTAPEHCPARGAEMSESPDHDWVRGAPSDVLHAVVAVAVLVLALVLGRLFDQTIVAAAAQLLEGLESLPSWVIDLIALAGGALTVGLLGAGLVVAVTGRHWRLLSSATLAAAVAAAIAAIVSPAIDASSTVVPTSDLALIDGRVPSAALLAAATATVVVTVTSLPRLWRRLAWTMVIALLFLRFLGAPLSLDAVVAVLTGWAVGSIVVVLLGAPSRRPTAASVLEGLAAVGIDLTQLEPAAVDARGSTPYFGRTAAGDRYFVKVLGGDERSADLLFRVWRFVQPRNLGDQRPFSSLRRGVEHEALVASMARQFGLRAPMVAGFATAHPNGYVLVYEAIEGRSLDGVAVEEMTDEVLDQAWAQLAELRRHRIAHRDLRLANVFLDSEGSLFLIDFGFSELAAEDLLLQTDIAELLASSASVVGVERALRSATRAVGPAAVADAAPRLVPSRLSGATRTAMKAAPALLEELRAAAGAAPADRSPE